jgi:pyruvate ferredoxin oxidoreductase beta subunit
MGARKAISYHLFRLDPFADFIRFARTEGRFAKHFDKDGNPSATLLKAKQERLENWRTLQELAGII